MSEPVAVKVWGDFAAFVRPEQKAERVSYPMMTPSAASRGILASIFWKPEFKWRVRKIEVLRADPAVFPGLTATMTREPEDAVSFFRFFSIMRNEVDRRASEASPISIMESRTQRHSLILRDVAYVIHADVEVIPGVNEDPAKYRDQFRRRVQKGQSFQQPYLGCREFACFFAPLDGTEESLRYTHADTIDMGLMLFDIKHASDESGSGMPIFFEAQLVDGTLNIAPDLYRRHNL